MNTIDNGGTLINFADLATVEDEDYLCAPLIRAGSTHSLTAEGGCGKSLLALEVALGIATGQRCLLNGSAEPATVLYLDYEMGPAKLKRRLLKMGVDLGSSTLQRHLKYVQGVRLPSLDTEEGGAALTALVEHFQPALVVIDTLSKAVLGEETSNTVFSKFARYSLAPLTEAGVAVLILDHTGHSKKQRARGAAAKRDNVDVNYLLQRTPGSGKHSLQVVMDKDREGDGEDAKTVVLKMQRVDTPRLHHDVATHSLTPAQERVLAYLIDCVEDEGALPTYTEAMEGAQASKRDVSAARRAYEAMEIAA